MGGIHHEQIDEVAPEEAGRPENDESSYRTAGQISPMSPGTAARMLLEVSATEPVLRTRTGS